MKILLIEDDDAVIAVLTQHLSVHHYVVDVVKDGETGWTYASTFEYDLIVLDIMLPKLDGIALCQKLRAEGYTTPILLLTAQESSTAKIQGLNAGADDYVLKPFDPQELIARIRALLRRSGSQPLPLLTWGDLRLNPITCEVTYNNNPLILTTKEYDLLELLLQDSRHVLSSDEILDRLWSSEDFPAEATVRSHMRRLRHKLQGAGAPNDFISTLHGRGYYLKPTASHETGLGSSVVESTQFTSAVPLNPSLDSQAQYVAFLNETWQTTQSKCLEQLAILIEIVKALQHNQWTETLPQQESQQIAYQVAHKLVGTLGIFGLTEGEHLARRIEQMFNSTNSLTTADAPTLAILIATLQQDIQRAKSIHPPQSAIETLPSLLIVDSDSDFIQPLEAIAEQKGIQIIVAPSLEGINTYLEETIPSILLLRSAHVNESFAQLKILTDTHPSLPILVVGNRDELSDRLNAVRRGGKFLLEQSATPAQIIDCALDLAQRRPLETKVMIVDDDADWLQTLPRLLEPWHFKVTTLADPQQFWPVLKSVNPDALVLDVKMPEVNGFELCQVLRSDPHWQRLPVLFVSALADSSTQNQAFTIGADDYLCKPVLGGDLANRILSRLARIRTWANP